MVLSKLFRNSESQSLRGLSSRIYEWAVVGASICVAAVTIGGVWFLHVDGTVVAVPVVFYKDKDFIEPVMRGGVTHRTTKDKYLPGETVFAEAHVDKRRDIPGEIQWQLMDRRFYPYAARQGQVPVGRHNITVHTEKIPLHVPPGTYHFIGSVKHGVNFIRDVYTPTKTNCFEVMEGPVKE
jgi:hypothetical protein